MDILFQEHTGVVVDGKSLMLSLMVLAVQFVIIPKVHALEMELKRVGSTFIWDSILYLFYQRMSLSLSLVQEMFQGNISVPASA